MGIFDRDVLAIADIDQKSSAGRLGVFSGGAGESTSTLAKSDVVREPSAVKNGWWEADRDDRRQVSKSPRLGVDPPRVDRIGSVSKISRTATQNRRRRRPQRRRPRSLFRSFSVSTFY
jgi:hypothetical protein